MRDDDPAGLADGPSNRLPVIRTKRAQVDDLGLDAKLALRLLRGLQCSRDQRSIGDDGQVLTPAHHLRLAERNRVIRTGIYRTSERLAIKPLVLEKEHGVIAADGGSQEAGRVKRIRRHDNADARGMREDAFATLRVVNRSTRQVAADGDPNNHRAAEGAIRSPAQNAEFIAHLVHGRPDVIKELNFDDRLEAAGRHADGATDDIRLGQR